jgi:alanine racemase
VHAANSAATIRFPNSRADLVRPGLAVYGGGFAEDLGGQGFRPVVRLVTQVVQIREVPAGTAVSYGALWKAQRRSRLAILPIGYADGVPKSLTGRADVLIRGQRCPVVGAVCMDIAVVDVTALGDAARVGDEVVLLGAQGNAAIRVSEYAERAGLIPWEVTCGITKRVPRVHLYA